MHFLLALRFLIRTRMLHPLDNRGRMAYTIVAVAIS